MELLTIITAVTALTALIGFLLDSRYKEKENKLFELLLKKEEILKDSILKKENPVSNSIETYHQWWHRKTISADSNGTTVFFKEPDEDIRVSNIEEQGQLHLRKAALIKRLSIKFPSTDSIEDIRKFFDNVVVRLHIEGNDAWRWAHLDRIEDGFYSVDLSSSFVAIGAGQYFNVCVFFTENIGTATDLHPTIFLETMTSKLV